MRTTLFFDGACEPVNPGGIATWGIAVEVDAEIVHTDSGAACEPFSPRATNNLAEYVALIQGLRWCLERGIEKLTVKGDSQLVIRQMTGVYAVTSPNIVDLHREASSLAGKMKQVKYIWIPRKENRLADSLAGQAYLEMARGVDFGSMRLPWGKYRGMRLSQVLGHDRGYVEWLLRQRGRDPGDPFCSWVRQQLGFKGRPESPSARTA